MTNYQKGIAPIIIVLAIVGILVAAAGFWYWQSQEKLKKLEKESFQKEEQKTERQQESTATEKSTTTKSSKDETADWKTYRNDSYRFQFKYPDNWLTFSENKEKYSIIAYSRRDFEIEKKYKIAPVYSFLECPPDYPFLNIADQSYVSFDSKELPLHGQPRHWLLVRTARLPENSSEIYLYYYGFGEKEYRPAKIDIKDIDDLFNNKNLSIIDKIKKENETNLTSGYGRWERLLKNAQGININDLFSLYMPLGGSRCGYYSSSFEFFSKGRYITLQFLSQTNRIQDEGIFHSIVSTFEFLDN